MIDLRRGVFAFSLLMVASPARADEPKQRAEALFQQARELMAKNDFPKACPLLEQSYKLDQGTGTLLALAICHEGNGKPASALREFNEVKRAAVRTNRSDRVMLAESHVQELEAKVPRVVVRPPSPEPAGLAITLDDQPIDRAAMLAGAPVDPGEHAVVAKAPDTISYRASFTVALADKTTIDIPALVSTAPKPAPVVAKPRTLGWVLGGVGVAGLAVTGVFGAMAFSAEADSEKECRGTRCTQRGVDLNHEASRNALVADVSAIIGGLALGAGLYLLFRRHDSPPAASAMTNTLTW